MYLEAPGYLQWKSAMRSGAKTLKVGITNFIWTITLGILD